MFIPEEQLEEAPEKFDWQPIIRLVLMTALFTVVILVMGALVNWLMGIIVNQVGDQGTYLVMLVGLIGMTIAIAVGVLGSVRISIGEKFKDNQPFTWWVVNRLAFLTGSTNLAGFMIFFLQEHFPELSGEKAAGPATTITMFVGIFILVSALPSGWLSDRFGKKNIILASVVLTTLGTAFVVFSPTIPPMYIGGSLVGAGIGFFYSANWALGTEIVPKKEAGRFLGISNLAGAGAGAVGAYIGGPIADQIGYTPLMITYGILFLLSIFSLYKIKTN